MSLHILVLAGGSGTRLWPLSRRAVPKHLLPLGAGGETLLRTTVERVQGLGQTVSVVTAQSHVDACRRALAGLDLGEHGIIAEPQARGTGPALGLATRLIAASDPEAVICSVHADHQVGDTAAYREAVIAAAGWAEVTDGLATVGIVPAHAATGFGYIHLGEARTASEWLPPTGSSGAGEALLRAAAALPASRSLGFAEKPDADTAATYVAGGRHLWNLGLFAWPAARFLSEFAAADAALDAALARVAEAWLAGDEDAASERYSGLAPVAIEPLIFERTPQLTVVQAQFPWSDLGSWSDLLEARLPQAGSDNVLEGDAMALRSSGCLVSAQGGRPVVVLGCQDLIVVDAGDAVLVVPAAQAQHVKRVVDVLTERGRTDLL